LLDFGVKGDVNQQAMFVGTLASLGEAGVKQYLGRSKSAEARNTVGAISRGLVAYMEREELGAGGKTTRPKRFPASAPRTPAKVPKGVAEPVTDKTWSHATWKAIKFSMEMPTRYSYEIITSGDGKTATVRATGDLDGDGKFSTFERKVTVGKDGSATMSPQVDVKDELE
jgi:type IV pilus assembly protein PilA